METPGKTPTDEIETLAKIIRLYNHFLLFLKGNLSEYFEKKLGITPGEGIVDIQRGLISNQKMIQRNYLSSPHGIIEDKLGIDDKDRIRCIKFTFGSGKELILVRNISLNETPEGTVNLDDIYFKLSPNAQKKFDEHLVGITKIESSYFNQQKSKINNIQTERKDDLLKTLDINVLDF